MTSVTAPEAAARLAAVSARVAAACRRAGRDPAEVSLLAASKHTDAAGVTALARAGQRLFGENRVQDAAAKFAAVPGDIRNALELHMIGHLQTNKAAAAARQFDMVETVDSVHAAGALARTAEERPPMPVLLQVNVSRDPAKSGFAPEALLGAAAALLGLPGIDIRGLMTISALVATAEQARPAFQALRELRDRLAGEWPARALAHLSMGMSADLEVAIEEGATIVRVGTALFGGHD